MVEIGERRRECGIWNGFFLFFFSRVTVDFWIFLAPSCSPH